jgi:hypothetical protein
MSDKQDGLHVRTGIVAVLVLSAITSAAFSIFTTWKVSMAPEERPPLREFTSTLPSGAKLTSYLYESEQEREWLAAHKAAVDRAMESGQ